MILDKNLLLGIYYITMNRVIIKSKLTHNVDLSRIAQNHANYLAQIKSLVHSNHQYQGKPLGENLAYAYDSTIDYYSGN